MVSRCIRFTFLSLKTQLFYFNQKVAKIKDTHFFTNDNNLQFNKKLNLHKKDTISNFLRTLF